MAYSKYTGSTGLLIGCAGKAELAQAGTGQFEVPHREIRALHAVTDLGISAKDRKLVAIYWLLTGKRLL